MASKRICLVTEELPGFGPSGGIGAAFEELAVLLARADHEVTILYCGPLGEGNELPEAGASFFRNEGISILVLDVERFTNVRHELRANSYSVWRTLQELDGDFDVIHFHDYKGLAFYSCEGRRQGIALRDTKIVVQLHGPTRWTVETNRRFFSEESQLIADHLERRSVEMADLRVSPSDYLTGWVKSNWNLSENCEIETIPNLCSLLEQRLRRTRRQSSSNAKAGGVRNLVIFGRHEARKGIDVASSALTRLNEFLTDQGITVHFVGQQGMVNGQPSALFFSKAAKSWTFDYTFNFGLNRFTAGEYIAALANTLVVVPAPIENSPYAVLEPLILGLPVLSSDAGGGSELVASDSRANFCCRMDTLGLEAALRSLLDDSSLECRASSTPEEIEKRWLGFHDLDCQDPVNLESQPSPLVTVGITHFERPYKLGDAVISMLKQDYQNLEIIVLDDGSEKAEAVEALNELETFLNRANVKLLREPNKYLGAARNKIIEHANGEYIVFLDDDDLALPNLVSTLVQSATRTQAAVTSCMSHYMNEDRRSHFLSGQDVHEIVDYFPSNGPLSLALEQNVFGTATSLIRLESLRAVGGYTEIRNVGNEDFELYIRLSQEGESFAACPVPLFMYEVGRPSMLSATSMDASFRRCFDALEFGRNSQAWADYSNLNVGRQLTPRSQNRLYWLNTFQDDGDERNRLCDPAIGARDYVQLAANVADRSGSPRVANAFRHAFDVADQLQKKAAGTEDEEKGTSFLKSTTVAATAPLEIAMLPSELRRARHFLVTSDVKAGVAEIERYLQKTHSLDEAILIPVRELASVPSSDDNRAAIAALVDKLREKRYRGSINDILLTLFRVAHCQELWSLRTEVAEQMLEIDRVDYRKRYTDIRNAENRGTLKAFEHFIKSGESEGRVGFGSLTAILNILKEESGVSYVLADYQDLFSNVDRAKPTEVGTATRSGAEAKVANNASTTSKAA